MKRIIQLIVVVVLVNLLGSCTSNKPMNAALQDNDPKEGPVKRLELANKYYEDGDYYKAIQLYKVVINERVMVDDLEEVYFKYANAHFAQEDYGTASNLYNSFYRGYPTSENAETAYYFRALCSYELSEEDHRLDQTTMIQSMKEFQDYMITFPEGTHREDAQAKIDEIRLRKEKKEIHTGRLYARIGEYKAAIAEYNRFIEDYPTSTLVEDAYYELLDARYMLAKNSIEKKKKERYEDVVRYGGYYMEKYSTGPHASKVKELIKLAEKDLNQL